MRTAFTCLLVSILCSTLSAQESSTAASKPTKAEKELVGIEWLKQFEGTWATAYDGTMHSRVIANKWLVSEISFSGAAFSVQTLGWDEKKKSFVGSWIDGTSSHVWRYSGKLDKSGTTILLEAEGPDLQDPTVMRMYRDSYKFVTKDKIASKSEYRDEKGKWVKFSEADMTRKTK